MILTTKEAALLIGLKQVTIKKFCQHGVLKAIKKGKTWLINEEDALTFKKLWPGLEKKNEKI